MRVGNLGTGNRLQKRAGAESDFHLTGLQAAMTISAGKLIDDAGRQRRGIAGIGHVAKMAGIVANVWQCFDWNAK
ncbi:hypothetical protein D3C76_1826830 [compost metagenome]